MKNKWLLIAVILLAIGGVIGYFASRTDSGATPITTNPTPIQPPIQPPVQTAPTVTNEPAPAGVIEITAKKLASEIAADWTKYKRGTIFQVSGLLKWQKERFPVGDDVYFFLGPAVNTRDYPLGVIFSINVKNEPELFKALTALEGDREIVVRGTYSTFDNSYMQGVILENVSLISPTK